MQNLSSRTRSVIRLVGLTGALAAVATLVAFAAVTVPQRRQDPGHPAQRADDHHHLGGNCGCHSFSPGATAPADSVPVFGWDGGMMANAGA